MSVEDFAKKTGFDPVSYIGDWQGYKVYEPDIYSGDEPICIGYPLVILEKDNKYRVSEPSESLDIRLYFYPDDEDDEE